jgi:hypothetical protein
MSRHASRFLRAVVFLAALACARAHAAGPAPAPHELVLSTLSPPAVGSAPNTIDLGDARVEDRVTESFRVLNDTGRPLVVTNITASCGCTSASLDRTAIDPRGEAELRMKISTGAAAGLRVVTVSFDGGSATSPAKFTFRVALHVRTVFALPDNDTDISIGQTAISRSPVIRVVTVGKGDARLEWDGLAVESDNPQLSASAQPVSTGEWRVRFSIDPRGRLGPFAGNVTLRALDHGGDTGYTVLRHVSAWITGPVRAAPGSWLIGQAVPGHVAEQSIHILPTGSDDEQAEFLDATASDPKTVEIVKDATRKDRFAIRYKPPATLGRDSGYVDARVSTRHGQYTIRIFYLALVLSPEPPAAGPVPTLAPPKESDGPDASP